jgi:uncharacterized protein YgbK (DUF1537 family)
MDELAESFTIALPALPVNGCTTYMGYHFVHGQLLSESPMRNHPLNPMSEPNLVRLLQCQTRRNVGSAALPAVAASVSALYQEFGRLRCSREWKSPWSIVSPKAMWKRSAKLRPTCG